jgi:hypothetical protein
MGREAEGHAVWRGASGTVRASLERDGIILRGEVRGRLPRAGLADWQVDGEDLRLRSDGDPLILTLGAGEAAAWEAALARPLPSLAARLGVSDGARAWMIGGPPPAEIAAAVAGATVPGPAAAAMIVAVLHGPEDLAAALAVGGDSGLRVWCIHGKGKGAAVGDTAVRSAFRAAGWMDIKTSAVSDTFTATLYRPPADARLPL